MPPTARRDDLVTVLLERLDRFEAALAVLQQSITRIEAHEEQARSMATAATLRLDELDKRVADLEASKHRAEGAAWAGKLVWAAGLALAGAVGAGVHFLLK